MANDSSDLINRAAQLRHNDLTVLGGNGDNVWGNHETTKIGDGDHDNDLGNGDNVQEGRMMW